MEARKRPCWRSSYGALMGLRKIAGDVLLAGVPVQYRLSSKASDVVCVEIKLKHDIQFNGNGKYACSDFQ